MYHQTYFKRSKYNNIKTPGKDGYIYDSKFEESVAQDLELRKKAGDIKDWDRQYKVEIYAYQSNGNQVHVCDHKIDFRIHHNDGNFELYEAKGVETTDYKWRRKMLEKFWLPEHLDHTYTVVKQRSYYRG